MSVLDRNKTVTIENLPRHIAIIMDGNNRWAKQRGLPGVAGHRAGVEAVRALLTAAEKHGVEIVTLFAFSSENWQRPPAEVRALMALFLNYLKREVAELNERGVRIRFIGDRQRFSERLQRQIREAESKTEQNSTTTLVIAADYGGQWDICQAAQQAAKTLLAEDKSLDQLTPELLNQYVCLSDLPPPDLCIRSSGEHRISNFMLWQLAYAELYFTDTYWPDFDEKELLKALQDYSRRQRRFGKRESVEAVNSA